MKTKISLIVALFAVMLLGCRIDTLNQRHKEEAEVYRANTDALMQDVKRYHTADSLNVVQTNILRVELDEYKKYRADDLRVIEKLQTKNRELQSVTDMQTQTIVNLACNVRDSIIYINKYKTDTLRCLACTDPYYTLNGCINKYGKFEGTINITDTLLMVQTIKKKKFLGFLWKTKAVKDRHIDIVNKNPYTHIAHIEKIELLQ